MEETGAAHTKTIQEKAARKNIESTQPCLPVTRL